MIEISPNLLIAKEEEVLQIDKSMYSLVSLASTYHYQLHNWSRKDNHKDSPHYIWCIEDSSIMSINWVDGPPNYFNYNGEGLVVVQMILSFIEKELVRGKKVVIMCNQGVSRSPTIGMLYLAKREKILPESFTEAITLFKQKYYPFYAPGGISSFIASIWYQI